MYKSRKMRVRKYHQSILISEHAKQRFLERLNIDITKHSSIDMSKLPAVAVRTLRNDWDTGCNTKDTNISTHYLARIKNEDVVLVVEESDIDDSYETRLSTVINSGHLIDDIWIKGINKLNNKLKAIS
jgi:hypothetical protein